MNGRTTLSLAALLAVALSTPLAAQNPMKSDGKDAPKLTNGSLQIKEIPGPRTVGPGGVMQRGLQTGDLLEAQTGIWTPAGPMLEVQWWRCVSGAPPCTPIPGATHDKYMISKSDEGAALAFSVTAMSKGGNATYQSRLTEKVEKPKEAAPKLQPGSELSIRREATPGRGGPSRPMEVGDELIAMPGTWDKPLQGEAVTQWERCPSQSPDHCRPILGKKGPRYTVTLEDVGSQLRVVQTATSTSNVQGTAESKNTTQVVPAQPTPTKKP